MVRKEGGSYYGRSFKLHSGSGETTVGCCAEILPFDFGCITCLASALRLSLGGELIWQPDVLSDVFADLDARSYQEWKDVCKQCRTEQPYHSPQRLGLLLMGPHKPFTSHHGLTSCTKPSVSKRTYSRITESTVTKFCGGRSVVV